MNWHRGAHTVYSNVALENESQRFVTGCTVNNLVYSILLLICCSHAIEMYAQCIINQWKLTILAKSPFRPIRIYSNDRWHNNIMSDFDRIAIDHDANWALHKPSQSHKIFTRIWTFLSIERNERIISSEIACLLWLSKCLMESDWSVSYISALRKHFSGEAANVVCLNYIKRCSSAIFCPSSFVNKIRNSSAFAQHNDHNQIWEYFFLSSLFHRIKALEKVLSYVFIFRIWQE